MFRRLALTALVVAVVAAVGGWTAAAFTSQTSTGATFAAATAFGPTGLGNLGSTTCGTTSSTLVVPAGGVPAGQSVVGVLGLRDLAPAGGVSATDSRGNTYAIDRDFTNSTMRAVVLHGYVATALLGGDTITATHPATASSAFAARASVDASIPVARTTTNAAGGTSASPSVSMMASAPTDAVVGVEVNQNVRTVTESPGWATFANVAANCGGAAESMTLHAGYQFLAGAGMRTYAPTIDASERWAAAIVGYRG